MNPEIETPNLDRLAEQGTTFNSAHCPNPICLATGTSILTGTYPIQHGYYSLGTVLSEEEHTICGVFQSTVN